MSLVKQRSTASPDVWEETDRTTMNLFKGVLFFFSSRRRHTRLVSDWSSDVCSSDLGCSTLRCTSFCPRHRTRSPRWRPRSEERRVGKECRSWWSLYNQKKPNTYLW